MALSADEKATFDALKQDSELLSIRDERLSKYYEGWQRLEHIGIAVPPELRKFEMIVNWPRVLVDTTENRQDVRTLLLPGKSVSDPGLREGWDANNLDSELSLFNKDRLIYGRAFLAVGTNDEDRRLPLISVESPREITVSIDRRRRRIDAALRLYGQTLEDTRPKFATLYLPNVTIWLRWAANGVWAEEDRDQHNLGRVALVMSLNRRRTGQWNGVSAMADIIPLTDAASRSLTNLQLAAEGLAVPQKVVLGMKKEDFIDPVTKLPIPAWESYFGALWTHTNADAKIASFPAADLKNFHDTVNHYGGLASSISGFPARYFGINTTNPPSEGSIQADESQMVKGIERHNSEVGATIGWTMALYERFRTGKWIDGNQIKVEWHDPGTPTTAQRMDAIMKANAGVPVLSREGSWDELGWTDARKDRERAYFEAESADPYLGLLKAKHESEHGNTEPALVGA